MAVISLFRQAGLKYATSARQSTGLVYIFKYPHHVVGRDNLWPAVEARNFRPPGIKEGKQAEFLMHESFPWSLVARIGVYSQAVAVQVSDVLRDAEHRPAVEIRREWYY
ncbi:MAG: DUF4433 domain-containing protein [Magnetospirillum sp. WYHS-4]